MAYIASKVGLLPDPHPCSRVDGRWNTTHTSDLSRSRTRKAVQTISVTSGENKGKEGKRRRKLKRSRSEGSNDLSTEYPYMELIDARSKLMNRFKVG